MVLRLIPQTILSLEDLQLPEVLKTLANRPKGLVLVTGPTGSGKSTTLAAMVDWINRNKPAHILTIEDPIEFVHTSRKALVRQREVGHHTLRFKAALRAALREDPDVILIGEIRDGETLTRLRQPRRGTVSAPCTPIPQCAPWSGCPAWSTSDPASPAFAMEPPG